MKKFFYLLLIPVMFSCSEDEEGINPEIWGTWEDIKVYHAEQIIDDQHTMVTYSDIRYHIHEDGSYEVENEIYWGAQSGGKWSYDEDKKIIHFYPDARIFGIEDEELGIDKNFSFEILSMTNDYLTGTYRYQLASLGDGHEPVDLKAYREFKKI